MSMVAITAFQLVGIVGAYLVITVIGPHLVIGKTVRFRNRYERFMMYSMIGNFYVMNLVYLLQLLHISYPVTLILFTVVPCAAIKIKLERIPVATMVTNGWDTVRKIFGGQLTIKAIRDARKPYVNERRVSFRKKIINVYAKNWLDVVLIIGIIVAVFWEFGIQLFESYGYKASDLNVHNYWINKLSENVIFVRGIYPYGFHVVLYYMHAVFGIDTFVLLRLMSIVAVMWVCLLLFCFLKLVCKSRFIPYVGVFAYVLGDYFEKFTYSRFGATLPQEYGVMFLFPAIYSGFAFFKEQQLECHGSVAKKTYIYLAGFCMSFSMALSTHFYGAMAIGIYCVAMVIGFGARFIKPQYFVKIIVTFLISLFIAILPMGIAYASGTELQGSLGWGLNIIFGGSSNNESANNDDEEDNTVVSNDTQEEENEKPPIISQSYTEKYGPVIGRVVGFVDLFKGRIDYASLKLVKPQYVYYALLIIPICLIQGIVCISLRKLNNTYGMIQITHAFALCFMTILISAGPLKIVALMDVSRGSIYFTYFFIAFFTTSIDGFVYLLSFVDRKGYISCVFSLIIFLLFMGYTVANSRIRPRLTSQSAISNDEVECLTKIIDETKDYSWTICSANDAGQMVYDHGYHFEMIDFLSGMEYFGSLGWVKIPSEIVFVFIEKYPVDYYAKWENSGTPVSQEYAEEDLPSGRTLGIYQRENRWICMSRMYEWAQAFETLYPNEMSVYYETDDFVCYKIIQNPYRLFNFAIDYKYNKLDKEKYEFEY